MPHVAARRRRLVALSPALLLTAALACAQQPRPVPAPMPAPAPAGSSMAVPSAPPSLAVPAVGDGQLTIDRIFRSADFRGATLPSVHWLADGESYLDTRPAAEGGGSDIVRVKVADGSVTVLAPASALVDAAGARLDVEDIQLSADETKALLFHSSVRVWRTNSRGRYHVIDFASKKVTPIARVSTSRPSGATTPDTARSATGGRNLLGSPDFLAPPTRTELQMFAKFSPDGRHVAFVRDNNLFVTEIATGRETRLTSDGGPDIINGTTDWVYEEELGLQDAFRWSPDSRRIAFWRFDQRAVPAFPIVDETSALYPVVGVLRYPKAGAPNSRVKVGVITLAAKGRASAPRWLEVGGDTGIYIARMDWVGADSLAVQRLPRKQNQLDLLMLSATSGRGRTVHTERDSAYVDAEGDAIHWMQNEQQFIVRSDRSGWRQLYLYDRSGRLVRQLTADGADVLSLDAVDEATGQLYATVAAPTPTQRQVFRYPLAGGPGQRVTQAAGTHAFDIGPTAKYAVDTYSRMGVPPTVTVYALPDGRAVRTAVDNAALIATLGKLTVRAPEFMTVPMPDGTGLDAYRIVPANFDSTKKYPVLMHLYGGPAIPTVNDSWGGRNYLWHQMLAQRGYVVVVMDARGAAWRGREFRKGTQYQLGVKESQDQMDGARWLGTRSWVDASRIGMWGWSYGGYMTAMTLARGGSLFKAGIAVAPVSDWRFYDTIYTERFMWLPSENAEGYKASSVMTYLPSLTAKLLLVHGTGDDNVHPQNTLVLANALEAANKQFLMLLYPNRTHSISGGNTQLHLFESFTRFLMDEL